MTKINVIPSRAQLRVDCRVPPSLDEDVALGPAARGAGRRGRGPRDRDHRKRVRQRLGAERAAHGDDSALDRRTRRGGIDGARRAARVLGLQARFRRAFPDLVAYGFFPQRHQSLLEVAPLVHNADERIDVRDLGFATEFFTVHMTRTAARLSAAPVRRPRRCAAGAPRPPSLRK